MCFFGQTNASFSIRVRVFECNEDEEAGSEWGGDSRQLAIVGCKGQSAELCGTREEGGVLNDRRNDEMHVVNAFGHRRSCMLIQ